MIYPFELIVEIVIYWFKYKGELGGFVIPLHLKLKVPALHLSAVGHNPVRFNTR
jgi:hypothetical protein